MNAALILMVCLAQQPRDVSLAQGLARVQELALAAQKDEALALCDQLLARHTGRERAALEYARGVVHAGAQEREPARAAFERSRAEGAGELRLASMYNLGTLALEQGEDWFHKLPEVSGQPAAQPAAQGAPPGPDPLAQARQSYLAARERLVERLRAQWNDADTRANLELVQRRLKRLDEIEKQRKEEQQKKDQQQKQDSKNEKSDPQKPDPKDKPDPDKPPPDPKNGEPQDPQDPEEKDKDKQDPQKPEPPKPEDQTQPAEQPKSEPKDAPQPQLSKEELTRLLDKLQQLEDQAAKLRAQIHKARRVAVKKDW